VRRGLLLFVLCAWLVPPSGVHAAGPPPPVEVVVTLDAPPLARAIAGSRTLTAHAKNARLDLRAPTSVSYLRRLAAAQRAFQTRLARAIPDAQVRWRYSVVLNGLAVVVPPAELERLGRLPGVARVYPSIRYRARLDRTPGQIGAPALWGPDLGLAGAGQKIGILDDGVDQTHPFFDPQGYAPPAGFPKGQEAFTTAKVIVARAFAPPTPKSAEASRPFDTRNSEHATHVAGIAAGNRISVPNVSRNPLSGVAPRAYIGNYKVLTIPTPGVGLDGNSPEIAAGIEAAVKDGMDVINLSLGEPEIEPSRDLVVQAINAAADAGVVPAIAAGNDFDEFGDGSVGSPGTAAKAITAASVSSGRSGDTGVVSAFSSGGPTPISLQLKPDVAAPGGEVLSSVPQREGLWDVFSGTSMAAPHVAGSAALLRQRHPDWTVAQLKSALVLTGDPASADTGLEARTTREGGGRINLVRANEPLVFAQPASLSLGRLRRGTNVTRPVTLADAGGGAGDWAVSVVAQNPDPGVTVTVPAAVTVPGRLDVAAAVSSTAVERSNTGFVILQRGDQTRRIPYWLDVDVPDLARQKATTLRKPGLYKGNTAGRPSLVSAYRYPEGFSSLAGPEQVFRVQITRPVANFGVVLLGTTRVQARIVTAADENRQVGYSALPINLNPYLPDLGSPRRASGALRPAPGAYSIVFDSPSRATAGRFSFRFWLDDTRPPTLRLLTRRVTSGGVLEIAASDAGSGIDPQSIALTIDGAARPVSFAGGRIRMPDPGLSAGRHRLALQVSDFQETRNNENVPRILPNTARLEATITIR
jgi:subtilisin family serine protease